MAKNFIIPENGIESGEKVIFLGNKFIFEEKTFNEIVLRCIDDTKELAKSCLTCQNRNPELDIKGNSFLRYCSYIGYNEVKESCHGHKKEDKHEVGLLNGGIRVVKK